MTKYVTQEFPLSVKQEEAYMLLTAPTAIDLVYGGGARGGKGLCNNSIILSKSGWKKVEDVTMNDELVAIDGTYTKITGIYPQGVKQTYRFTFDDGTKSIVDEDHLWTVWNADHGQRDGWIVKDTKSLAAAAGRYSIPLMSQPAPGDYEPEYDPYILGYIIGNGTLTGAHPTIYTADEQVVEYLKARKWRVYKYKESVYQCSLSDGEEKQKVFMELPRFSKQAKHIPLNLLNAKPEHRIALLQGLMDSDGCAVKDGTCTYSTMVRKLAEDVVYLVRSLGGKSSIETKSRIGGGFGGSHHELCVRVSHCNKFMPFRLKRKKKRVRIATYDKRYISKIEKLDMRETTCFSVAHSSKLFVIDGFVVTHNTWLGCFWVISSAKLFPGSAWLVAREELKALKRTTLRTLFKVLSACGLKDGVDFKLNSQDMIMTIFNDHGDDSVIFFGELRETPSDPEFDRLGSYDLTGYWIDEAQEVSKNAKDTLKARLTLLNGKGWETWPAALYTCNPGKNWIYSEFWRPLVREGKKEAGKAFIQALYSDNPKIDHEKYRNSVLSTKNKVKIERLLYGNFEYDSTPGKLCDYDSICDMFRKKVPFGQKALTIDPAEEGDDLAVIMEWNGWNVEAIHIFQTCKITGEGTEELPSLEEEVRAIASEKRIPMNCIVADGVGVGAGLVSSLGCRSYVGGRRAVQPEDAKYDDDKRQNFADLNAQCGQFLANKINSRQVAVCSTKHEEEIKEELDWIIHNNIDEDKPMRLMKKEDIKAQIGHSPNYRDAMMMRSFLDLDELKNPPSMVGVNLVKQAKEHLHVIHAQREDTVSDQLKRYNERQPQQRISGF